MRMGGLMSFNDEIQVRFKRAGKMMSPEIGTSRATNTRRSLPTRLSTNTGPRYSISYEHGTIVKPLLRAGRGMTRYANATTHAGAADLKPLTLYNYEGNQFARLAREALCELELPYTLFNCGKGSPKRATLTEVAGEGASVPYLVDPNTGQNVGESEEIVAYLFKTYGGAA